MIRGWEGGGRSHGKFHLFQRVLLIHDMLEGGVISWIKELALGRAIVGSFSCYDLHFFR